MLSEVAPAAELSVNDNNNGGKLINEDSIPFAGNIVGSEFANCVSLPLIYTPIEIEVGTRFYSMSIVVHFVEQYALQKNFAIVKYKNESFSDGTCRKRVFKCDLGGKYEKKLSRPLLGKIKNKGSKKKECMWQVNINWKRDSPIVYVTLFNNKYNYKISVETVKFTTAYRNFPEEIMKLIEFYVMYNWCDVTTIRNFL